ncbi:hypothetical protein CH363_08270 [Leptospira haakeii]|uniref:G-protein coupled receptors family 1 profile domain-containing protein n=1 Tax=Leptospira haakeii TaxID=2023198 RepID=A0ABX4PKH9_9LEPT|nr:hypothetical protein CH363_08270 [Leptospira haakeii]PKA18083.1 hypothetical protein CH377_19460 [Leptospira haakeii]
MDIFLLLYVLFFFLVPWIICAFALAKMIIKLYSIENGINVFGKPDIRKIRNSSPDFNKVYLNTIRWFLITLISWIVGFSGLFLIVQVF